jgi:hypothetical protein
MGEARPHFGRSMRKISELSTQTVEDDRLPVGSDVERADLPVIAEASEPLDPETVLEFADGQLVTT